MDCSDIRQNLWQIAQRTRQEKLTDLTLQPSRFDKMSYDYGFLMLDFSKNRLSVDSWRHLQLWAEKLQMNDRIGDLFCGRRVNVTESRPAMHMALRGFDQDKYQAGSSKVMSDVLAVRKKMMAFAEGVRHGKITGATGKSFKHIIAIGIGGSALGPELIVDALKPVDTEIEVHFAADPDGEALRKLQQQCDPEATLVCVISKSFTTLETTINARQAKKWLSDSLNINNQAVISQHMVGISASGEKMTAFGFPEDRQFLFWDWVGGRYSLWSSVGLPAMIAIGTEQWEQLLSGAHKMDDLVRHSDLSTNPAILLALSHVWHTSFLQMPAIAALPYHTGMRLWIDYLQQLEMESNGKYVQIDGTPVDYPTAPIIFGQVGNPAQHAFMQAMHQGTVSSLTEILLFLEDESGNLRKQALANGLAQADALLTGHHDADIQKACPGERPSNTIIMSKLDAYHLGALIALYEHKVFVESQLLQINAFDQMGVSLGKSIAGHITDAIEKRELPKVSPCSQALLNVIYQKTRS